MVWFVAFTAIGLQKEAVFAESRTDSISAVMGRA